MKLQLDRDLRTVAKELPLARETAALKRAMGAAGADAGSDAMDPDLYDVVFSSGSVGGGTAVRPVSDLPTLFVSDTDKSRPHVVRLPLGAAEDAVAAPWQSGGRRPPDTAILPPRYRPKGLAIDRSGTTLYVSASLSAQAAASDAARQRGSDAGEDTADGSLRSTGLVLRVTVGRDAPHFVSHIAHVGAPEGLALDPTGAHLYVANTWPDSIVHIELPNGEPEELARFHQPRALVVDGAGRYLYATNTDGAIVRVSLRGAPDACQLPVVGARFDFPLFLAIGGGAAAVAAAGDGGDSGGTDAAAQDVILFTTNAGISSGKPSVIRTAVRATLAIRSCSGSSSRLLSRSRLVERRPTRPRPRTGRAAGTPSEACWHVSVGEAERREPLPAPSAKARPLRQLGPVRGWHRTAWASTRGARRGENRRHLERTGAGCLGSRAWNGDGAESSAK